MLSKTVLLVSIFFSLTTNAATVLSFPAQNASVSLSWSKGPMAGKAISDKAWDPASESVLNAVWSGDPLEFRVDPVMLMQGGKMNDPSPAMIPDNKPGRFHSQGLFFTMPGPDWEICITIHANHADHNTQCTPLFDVP